MENKKLSHTDADFVDVVIFRNTPFIILKETGDRLQVILPSGRTEWRDAKAFDTIVSSPICQFPEKQRNRFFELEKSEIETAVPSQKVHLKQTNVLHLPYSPPRPSSDFNSGKNNVISIVRKESTTVPHAPFADQSNEKRINDKNQKWNKIRYFVSQEAQIHQNNIGPSVCRKRSLLVSRPAVKQARDFAPSRRLLSSDRSFIQNLFNSLGGKYRKGLGFVRTLKPGW